MLRRDKYKGFRNIIEVPFVSVKTKLYVRKCISQNKNLFKTITKQNIILDQKYFLSNIQN